MRTVNKHPQWHNVPLRISGEQKNNPLLVFNDFFDHYHLNDLREILWDWMVDVVSSNRGILRTMSNRDSIFFYENMELLIEAVYIMRNRMNKRLRRKAKRKKKFRSRLK